MTVGGMGFIPERLLMMMMMIILAGVFVWAHLLALLPAVVDRLVRVRITCPSVHPHGRDPLPLYSPHPLF